MMETMSSEIHRTRHPKPQITPNPTPRRYPHQEIFKEKRRFARGRIVGSRRIERAQQPLQCLLICPLKRVFVDCPALAWGRGG